MKEIHIFVDETGNPNVSSQKGTEKYFAIGSTIMETPVSPAEIAKAIADLASLADLRSTDKKTVARGYFHASFDGPEAHSKITHFINALNLDFEFTRVDKTELNGQDLQMSESAFHKHMTHLCALIGTRMAIDRMHINVAQRANSFDNIQEKEWTVPLYNGILYSITNTPLIPSNFPHIKLNVVSDSDPGVQVTDFLIWACQRKYIQENINEVWYKRLKSWISFEATVKELGLFSADLTVGKGTKTVPSIADYEFTYDEISIARQGLDTNGIANSLLLIENIVLHFLVRRHQEIEYLLPFVPIEANDIQKKQSFTSAHIKALCELFLMVFDTLNVLEEYSREERKMLLVAKFIACELVSRRHINWLFISNFWRTNHALFVDHHKF